jgi:hypothetical protein
MGNIINHNKALAIVDLIWRDGAAPSLRFKKLYAVGRVFVGLMMGSTELSFFYFSPFFILF